MAGRRYSRVPPPPPRGASRAFLRRYGVCVEPSVALQVADYVQKNSIDRRRFIKVDEAVARIAGELGVGKTTGYKFLNAGRWLLARRRRSK